jgi:cobalt-zinc-cadmium efflux system outer membrane protein
MTLTRWSWFAVSLILLGGCSFMGSQVDREISALASQVQHVDIHPAVDQAPAPAAPAEEMLPPPTPAKAPRTQTEPPTPAERPPTAVVEIARPATPSGQDYVLQLAYQQPEKKRKRLEVPPGLPGAGTPPITTKFPEDPVLKRLEIQRMFPPLPPGPKLRPPAPGPEGRPMTLSDLQRLAAIYSPNIKAARAALEAAKGAAKQAGAYPNPTFFFEQDTVGTGPGGYEGLGVNQLVKTANKLKLQQAAAMMDVLNAQLALKRAYTDLSYQVRTNYFAVLVALEGIKINQALYEFTDEIYRYQVDLVEGQQSAPYEAVQLRPLAIQARFNLIQAQNQYLASWKQLAAALGLRDMPPTEVVGRVDMPIPVYDYKDVLGRVLANHTDVRTAYNTLERARYTLQFAKVTPIPDVAMNVLLQKDYTAPPNLIVHSLQFAFPLPVWDQNVGNVKAAEGNLAQAEAGPKQARNNLVQLLADAFNRYETYRENTAIAMQQVRDQVRVYPILHERRNVDFANVGFGDLVVAQQTLAGFIAGYVTALGLQWTAVADVANLLQTDDLFQVGTQQEMAPVPDLRQLTSPCLPLPGKPVPQTGR